MPTQQPNEPGGSDQTAVAPTSRRRILKIGGLTAALGGAGYALLSNIAEVTEHREPLAGLKDEVRVLLVSDAHLPRCRVDAETVRSARRAFEPHAVIIAGDAIEKKGNEPLVEYFADLTAPAGTFAVLGNWEHWGHCDLTALRNTYEKIGVRLLINETVTLPHAGGVVRVVGLDDLIGGKPQLDLVRRQGEDEALLVVAHCPQTFDDLPDLPLVTLSGHTHGGQVAPFGIKLTTPRGSGRYFRGWYRSGRRRLFVTRGLGNSGPPLRIGSRPEIVLLTFTPTAT